MTQKFKVGDTVRFAATPESQNYAVTWGYPVDKDLKVTNVTRCVTGYDLVHVEGHHAAVLSRRFEKVEKTKAKGVLVAEADILAVLTKFVKEELGIDATVENVIANFDEALLLEFAA